MSKHNDANRIDMDVSDTSWEVVEQRHYDPDDGPDLTVVVLNAVASVEGVEATSIKEPVLYEAVDIAAIDDALFGRYEDDRRADRNETLSFEYRGHRVTVRSDGWVLVAERARGRPE